MKDESYTNRRVGIQEDMGNSSGEKGPSPVKLLLGVVGIYGAFMYYGVLQAGITKFESPSGARLEREW